jgi:aspartoacylase
MRMALRVKHALEARGNMPPFNLLVDSQCPRDVYNNIDGVTPSGLCIEVGPQAHGTLNNVALVTGTHLAVTECLNEIREFNERSKPPSSDGTLIQGFELWKTVMFPKGKSGAPTTVSACLHPSMVGADFSKELRKGDPLFVDLLTGDTVGVYEEEEPAYACFIGEAAYFQSGIAMWLCKKKTFFVYG